MVTLATLIPTHHLSDKNRKVSSSSSSLTFTTRRLPTKVVFPARHRGKQDYDDSGLRCGAGSYNARFSQTTCLNFLPRLDDLSFEQSAAIYSQVTGTHHECKNKRKREDQSVCNDNLGKKGVQEINSIALLKSQQTFQQSFQ